MASSVSVAARFFLKKYESGCVFLTRKMNGFDEHAAFVQPFCSMYLFATDARLEKDKKNLIEIYVNPWALYDYDQNSHSGKKRTTKACDARGNGRSHLSPFAEIQSV